ncbi:hypothetical protein N7490_010528 [Penicillium lividum]|nr:hypothetical protein N7490_010528 [Penicillium lividum]
MILTWPFVKFPIYRLQRRQYHVTGWFSAGGDFQIWQNPLASVALHPIIAILGFLLSSSPLELFPHKPDDRVRPLQNILVYLHADRYPTPFRSTVVQLPFLAALPSPSQCWRISGSTAPGEILQKQDALV